MLLVYADIYPYHAAVKLLRSGRGDWCQKLLQGCQDGTGWKSAEPPRLPPPHSLHHRLNSTLYTWIITRNHLQSRNQKSNLPPTVKLLPYYFHIMATFTGEPGSARSSSPTYYRTEPLRISGIWYPSHQPTISAKALTLASGPTSSFLDPQLDSWYSSAALVMSALPHRCQAVLTVKILLQHNHLVVWVLPFKITYQNNFTDHHYKNKYHTTHWALSTYLPT